MVTATERCPARLIVDSNCLYQPYPCTVVKCNREAEHKGDHQMGGADDEWSYQIIFNPKAPEPEWHVI